MKHTGPEHSHTMTIDIRIDALYNPRMSGRSMHKTIKKAALECGLTYREIAQLSSIDIGQVSRFMSGKRTMGLPAIERVCDTLGLSLQPKKRASRQRRKR